jgi:hypothetical protein
MIHLRRPLRILALAAVLAAITITPVLAQTTPPASTQTIATCDGQTFAGQSVDTQNQFNLAYGVNAANTWVQQHDTAAVAAGLCPPPAAAVAAAPVVVVEENRNGNNNSNGNSNDNNNNGNGNDNNNNGNDNNDDHRRPSVSLDVSRNDVNRGERFEIRVTGHREGDSRLERIWWWATDTNDSRLRDSHTHDCNDSDECRETWQESADNGGQTIRIHAQARNRDGQDSDEVTRDLRVR